MGAVGGSIESVSIRGRLFSVAADADVGLKLGGFEGEKQVNGDGSPRLVKTRVSWMLESVPLSVDHDRDDMAFLQEVADLNEEVVIAITLASGDVFHGKGSIVGEVKLQTGNATCSVGFAGGGRLTKQ